MKWEKTGDWQETIIGNFRGTLQIDTNVLIANVTVHEIEKDDDGEIADVEYGVYWDGVITLRKDAPVHGSAREQLTNAAKKIVQGTIAIPTEIKAGT